MSGWHLGPVFRWAALSAWLGLGAIALAGCGDDAASDELARGPSWLVPCAASSECANGQCVCGVCSAACGGEAGATCSGLPSGAACFARGSIARAAVCADVDVAGICLPSCRRGDDCGVGFTCDVGACVPLAARPDAGPGSATSRAYAELLPTSWGGVTPPETPSAHACDDAAECPTLEALLRTDACFEVMRGCGITYLNAHDGRNGPSLHYWYDAFGTPPLLRYDTRSDESRGSAPVTCDAVEMACWTCGAMLAPRPMALAAVACANVPAIWPAPHPARVAAPDCACELDGAGARVSLDCFCGIYPCPGRDELVARCRSSALTSIDEPPPVIAASLDESGQLWLSNARYAGQRYTFDAAGVLVGAVAFSQGPATLPCNTDWVAAGAIRAGDASETCECQGSDACSAADWFPSAP
ncbi:MAG TPA: hypothetical protein VMG12_28080 [Polyangiaceae bacterium]|nr:hypothetical protein [Polyangiaceae bacterium]